MTSIKDLLKRDIKNASRRIWKKAKTEIPPSEADELARLALEKSIGYKKLREIVDMLPDIKSAITGYALLQEDMGLTDINLVPDKCEKLHNKLEKWENS